KNTEMQLITESNEHGRRLSDVFMTWDVNENQIQLSDTDGKSNLLSVSVLNCDECVAIQAKNVNYNLKPEMLDVAMSVVNAPENYEILFIAEFKNKSELIKLEVDTLPQRFFLPLAKYADYIYNSD